MKGSLVGKFHGKASGFFAAEGNFGFYRKTKYGKLGGAILQIGQKERYWLDKLQGFYGIGGVYNHPSGSCYWVVNSTMAESLYGHFINHPINLDWVVGFWEGDGSISTPTRGVNKGKAFYGPHKKRVITFLPRIKAEKAWHCPIIQFHNTKEDLLYKIWLHLVDRLEFEMLTRGFQGYIRVILRRPPHKNLYSFQVYGVYARILLLLMENRIISPRRRAQIKPILEAMRTRKKNQKLEKFFLNFSTKSCKIV